MNQNQLYYRNSGKVPIVGLLLTLVLGFAASFMMAPIYAYATYYIPLAGIVTLLLALGAGFAVGFGVGKFAYIGKIRNSLITTALGLLIGINAWYLSWVFWVNIVLGDTDVVSSFFVLLLRPDIFIQVILNINAEGAWSIMGGTPTGVILWVLWALEFGIFVGTAVLTSLSIQVAPFCEACNQWCTPPVTVASLGVANEQVIRERLEQRDLAVFSELGPVEREGSQFTSLQLSHCDKCNQLHTLNAVLTTISYDDKGGQKQDDYDIVRDFIVTPQEAAWLAQLKATPLVEEASVISESAPNRGQGDS